MRNLFLAVLLCIAILSCRNNDLPAAPGKTLIRMEHYISNDTPVYVQNFVYDAQNKLVRLHSPFIIHDLAYDTQGKLVSITSREPRAPNMIMFIANYSHDVNGRIIKRTITPGTFSNTNDASYTYDAAGRVITDTQYISGVIRTYYKYQYDNSGNISYFEEYYNPGNGFIVSNYSSYQYDNKISPFHQVGKLLYYIYGSINYLSPSNAVRAIRGTEVHNLSSSYKYYRNGLLKSDISHHPIFPSGPERTEYVYAQP